MHKPQLTPREQAARPAVIKIVSRYTVHRPIPSADVAEELKQINYFINARSVRNICEYCCLLNPPIPLLYKSGHPGGLYRARNYAEAKPFIDDSGSRAFASLRRRQNVIKHLRHKQAVEAEGVAQQELF